MKALDESKKRQRSIDTAISMFEERFSFLVREFSSKEGFERDEAAFLEDRQALRDSLVESVLAFSKEDKETYNYEVLFLDAIDNVYRIQTAATRAALSLKEKIKKSNEEQLLGPEGDEFDERQFLKKVDELTRLWLLNQLVDIVGITEFRTDIVKRYLVPVNQ